MLTTTLALLSEQKHYNILRALFYDWPQKLYFIFINKLAFLLYLNIVGLYPLLLLLLYFPKLFEVSAQCLLFLPDKHSLLLKQYV